MCAMMDFEHSDLSLLVTGDFTWCFVELIFEMVGSRCLVFLKVFRLIISCVSPRFQINSVSNEAKACKDQTVPKMDSVLNSWNELIHRKQNLSSLTERAHRLQRSPTR